MKKAKTKKKVLTVLIVIVAVLMLLALAVQFVVRPIVVNYAFGKITSTVMQNMCKAENVENKTTQKSPELLQTEETEPAEDAEEATEKTRQEKIEQRRKEVDSMSVNQVASIVASDAGLTAQLEKIVSAADKEKVLSVLLSNFSKEEIAKYSAEVAGGISSKRKSELVALAKSRLTSAQWAQCMQLFSKYVDRLRPIIAEKTIN